MMYGNGNNNRESVNRETSVVSVVFYNSRLTSHDSRYHLISTTVPFLKTDFPE